MFFIAMSRWRKIQLSPYNKLKDLISFYEGDWYLCEFIDFVWFYGVRDHSRLLTLLRSDNGAWLYLSRRLCLNKLSWFANFRAMVSVSMYWSPVNVVQLREIKLGWKIVLDVDLYWKGLKLIREEWLRDELYLLFNYYLWMHDITITRADYTVDCLKLNFDKENKLKCRVDWLIRSNWMVAYKTFGRKWHDSARFLRYYNKKLEIITRWTEHLYPEYSLLPEVMRYELQVNSKWFDPLESEITIDDLYWFITLHKEIKSSKWKHLIKNKDISDEKLCIRLIKKLQRKKEYDSLDKIKLTLLWTEEFLKCATDSIVLCETSEVEKLFEPS